MEKKFIVYPTFPAFAFEEDGDNFSVEFDWEALGCPSDIHVKIGDKIIKIPLPEDFPETALRFEKKNLEVYEEPQSFLVTSTPTRTPRDVRFTFSALNITVAFQLGIGDRLLMDGNPKNGGGQDEPEKPKKPEEELYYKKSKDGGTSWSTLKRLTWNSGKKDKEKDDEIYYKPKREPCRIVYPKRSKFEEHVLARGSCRAECRWTSLIFLIREYSWKIHWTDIEQKKDHVLIKNTYKRKVEKIWHNYHCEKGKWTYKSIAIDKQTQWRTVTIKGK